eukprot:11349611-Heterocapsa_arctica.AAC.5
MRRSGEAMPMMLMKDIWPVMPRSERVRRGSRDDMVFNDAGSRGWQEAGGTLEPLRVGRGGRVRWEAGGQGGRSEGEDKRSE